MPFVKIWIHAVWATKNREPVLKEEIRTGLFEHIHQNAIKKEIMIDCVNGQIDHVHCLFRLTNDQSISKVIQLMKGESSYWLNKQNLISNKLDWQDDYFAVSVSESQVNTVRQYIMKQKEHHQTKSFNQEYEEFMKNYGFKLLKG